MAARMALSAVDRVGPRKGRHIAMNVLRGTFRLSIVVALVVAALLRHHGSRSSR
jgi:hypothetical protein